ncbi:nuclear transport factor 2 family protein [Pontibacter beigongshangensis]|uniref:nuclear transport factor 2 family protein n=1 Tax=Pontibacter beigongshangensis TaxID=2574733 RepID=UPI0019D5D170|nr:nuclear transport factor 2 family protein [Pontibacter beigongshangensis]
MTEEKLIEQFQQIEDTFNEAVVSNSVDKIRQCITSDWVLVDSQGGIIPQERFFSVLEQGLLAHTTMTKEVLRVKVYGDIALVTGRGQNTGTWQGQLTSPWKPMNGLRTFINKRKENGCAF